MVVKLCVALGQGKREFKCNTRAHREPNIQNDVDNVADALDFQVAREVRHTTPLALNAFEYSSRVRARLPVAFWFPLVPIATPCPPLDPPV